MSDGLYFLDPLSVAANGFDLFDQYSNALSVATFGFIKFKITSVTVKRRTGGEQGHVDMPPINIWKNIDPREEVPELEKIRQMIEEVNAKSVEITLEPLNNVNIELNFLKEEFAKTFKNFKIDLDYQPEHIEKEKKPEITIFLEMMDNI